MQDLIPLREAAEYVLARLVPAHVAASPGATTSLDLLAEAIRALVPVYTRDASGELRCASEAQPMRAGSGLLVKRSDAEAAGEKLIVKYVGNQTSAPAPYATERKSVRAR